MDPSTTAHIDPSTLHQTSTGPDGVPHLGVKPTSSTTTTTSPSTGTSSSAPPQATGLRQRVNNLGTQLDHATEHPAVKNAKGAAQKQVGQLRETLGRSQTVLDLERKTGVDRVALVFGGVFAYLLLIPLNLFGLALPTTTLLTLLPPSFLALGILESKIPNEQNEAATRALLSYFVTLGFIQFLESLAAGLLERRIPQYYTVKLLFLAYLLHPRTQGAMNLHNHVFRPLLARAQEAATPVNTPPQSNKDAGFSTTSPSAKPNSPAPGSGFSNASVGFDASGNITRDQASGQNFSVVNELH